MGTSIPSYDELAQILSTGELESEPKPTYSGKLHFYNFKGFEITETEKVLYSKKIANITVHYLLIRNSRFGFY